MVTIVDFGAYLGRWLKSTMALKELKMLSTQVVEGVFRDLFSDIHYLFVHLFWNANLEV